MIKSQSRTVQPLITLLLRSTNLPNHESRQEVPNHDVSLALQPLAVIRICDAKLRFNILQLIEHS